MLAAAGLDPTFVVGGRVNHTGSTARLGRGEYMVVEADESDRTFLLLAPVVAVVTTIDREHLDHLQIAWKRFRKFSRSLSIACRSTAPPFCAWTSPTCRPSFRNVKRPIITYGTSSQADLVISEIELLGLDSEFRLTYRGDDLGKFHLHGSSRASTMCAMPRQPQPSRCILNVPVRIDSRRTWRNSPESGGGSTSRA